MTDDDAIVSCVTLTGSEYVAMLAQAAELAKEITSLLNRLADERTENMRLREALNRPMTMDEVAEVGKAILPYIESEKTQSIGAIAHDAMVTVLNILEARAALAAQPAPGKEEA